MSKKEKPSPFIDLSSVEAKEIHWLMEPFIPFGMITIMEGDPGVGKSFLAMHIAAQISIGGSLPGAKKLNKGRVLYLTTEDDLAYTIRPRIDAMGGNPERIRVQADYLSLDDEGLDELLEEIEKYPPDIIIMDPLFAYVPSDQDMYRPNVIRSLLAKLKDLAEHGDIAILIIRHLTKGKRDKAIYQGGGSMDVIAAARSAILVAEDPSDPDQKIVAHLKHNIAPRGTSWIFKLIQEADDILPSIEWIGPSELTVEDLVGQSDNNRQSAVDQAIEFLKEELKERPRKVTDIEEKAASQKISKRTLARARDKIGIVPRKGKRGWMMSLPDET